MKKFCFACGKPLDIKTHDTFNENTGEKNTSNICGDIKCKEGCGYYYHHRWKSTGFFGFGDVVCSRCGYILPEVY